MILLIYVGARARAIVHVRVAARVVRIHIAEASVAGVVVIAAAPREELRMAQNFGMPPYLLAALNRLDPPSDDFSNLRDPERPGFKVLIGYESSSVSGPVCKFNLVCLSQKTFKYSFTCIEVCKSRFVVISEPCFRCKSKHCQHLILHLLSKRISIKWRPFA